MGYTRIQLVKQTWIMRSRGRWWWFVATLSCEDIWCGGREGERRERERGGRRESGRGRGGRRRITDYSDKHGPKGVLGTRLGRLSGSTF